MQLRISTTELYCLALLALQAETVDEGAHCIGFNSHGLSCTFCLTFSQLLIGCWGFQAKYYVSLTKFKVTRKETRAFARASLIFSMMICTIK